MITYFLFLIRIWFLQFHDYFQALIDDSYIDSNGMAFELFSFNIIVYFVSVRQDRHALTRNF